MPRNVIALYDDLDSAERAIGAIADAWVPRERISLLATEGDGDLAERVQVSVDEPGRAALAGAGLGAAVGVVVGFTVGLLAFLIPGVGPVIGFGPMAGAIGGPIVGAAAGGLIGALTARGVPRDRAGVYAEGLRRGGVLVVVEDVGDRAQEIERTMRLYGAVDLDERTAEWREGGWTRHEPGAPPLSPEEAAEERARLEGRRRNLTQEGIEAQGGQGMSVGGTSGRVGFDQRLTALREDELELREHPEYVDAFHYGQELAERHPEMDWEELEEQARREWRERQADRGEPSTWQKIWAAIRHGFDPEYPPPWRM